MENVKICSCGKVNPAYAILCEQCGADITRLPIEDFEKDSSPSPKKESEAKNVAISSQELSNDPLADLQVIDIASPFKPIEETCQNNTENPTQEPIELLSEGFEILYPEDKLYLETEKGDTIEVKSGDIIGRQEIGADFFQDYPTVSRRHAQMFKRSSKWFVKNFSDNLVFINEKTVKVGEEVEVLSGDMISLSSKCTLTVLI
jgi:hypothetical protein